jgi:hypothetical protein
MVARMNRRDFLKSVGAAAGAVLLRDSAHPKLTSRRSAVLRKGRDFENEVVQFHRENYRTMRAAFEFQEWQRKILEHIASSMSIPATVLWCEQDFESGRTRLSEERPARKQFNWVDPVRDPRLSL